MSLDKCISTTPTTGPGCIAPPVTCNSEQVPLDVCLPPPITPNQPKCVNDNARRPWPTPPPAEIGCSPVSLQITNKPPPEDDPDQTIRLEGEVSYISGDACLPQVNLNLVVPPNIASGGGSPSITGFAYTTYAGCARIGPTQNDKYENPQEFFAKEPGAASFVPKTLSEMGDDPCEPSCSAKSRYGAQIAKFNLIGPILAQITSSTAATWTSIAGEIVVTGWSYDWHPAFCVTASDMCLPACPPASWTQHPSGLEYGKAWNNKEMNYFDYLTPGVSLEDQVRKGYKPAPIMAGTQVFIYGWIPWGIEPPAEDPDQSSGVPDQIPDESACNCPMVWFFSEQNAFQGECREDSGTSGLAGSMMPTRSVTSAGMFFGAPDNANRV